MKPYSILAVILFLFLAVAAVKGTPDIINVTSSQDAAALVYVSGYDVNPAVFYPYETGTVTVHVTNSASAPVEISQPELTDPNVLVINNDSFTAMTTMGAGSTVDYTFLVTVHPPDGTYFPLFSVSPKLFGVSEIHSTLQLKEDSKDVEAGIATKPDVFAISRTDMVNISIVNPRDGDISELLIVPHGQNVNVSPSEYFAGTLAAHSAVQVPFAITPDRNGQVEFEISFRNGDNKHSTSTLLPVITGTDKTAAAPVVNDIAVTAQGNTYYLTGDVTNAGITDAEAMVLTVIAPAHSLEPFPEYAIGTLASDDFSSFSLSFTASDPSSVPIRITWKDADGNSFSTITRIDLRGLTGGTGSTGSGPAASQGAAAGASGTSLSRGGGNFPGGGGPPGGGSIFGFGGSRGGGLSSFYPVIGGALILAGAIGIWVRRKKILKKLRKQ